MFKKTVLVISSLAVLVAMPAQPVLAHNSEVDLIQNTVIGFGLVITAYVFIFVIKKFL